MLSNHPLGKKKARIEAVQIDGVDGSVYVRALPPLARANWLDDVVKAQQAQAGERNAQLVMLYARLVVLGLCDKDGALVVQVNDETMDEAVKQVLALPDAHIAIDFLSDKIMVLSDIKQKEDSTSDAKKD